MTGQSSILAIALRWLLTILVFVNAAMLILPAKMILAPLPRAWHTSGQVTITINNQTSAPILVTPIGLSDSRRAVPLQFYSAMDSPEIIPQRARFEIAPGDARGLVYNWWNWRARWIVVESGPTAGQIEVDQTPNTVSVNVPSLGGLQPLSSEVAQAHQKALQLNSPRPLPSPLRLWLPMLTFLPLFIYTLVLWSRAANPPGAGVPA